MQQLKQILAVYSQSFAIHIHSDNIFVVGTDLMVCYADTKHEAQYVVKWLSFQHRYSLDISTVALGVVCDKTTFHHHLPQFLAVCFQQNGQVCILSCVNICLKGDKSYVRYLQLVGALFYIDTEKTIAISHSLHNLLIALLQADNRPWQIFTILALYCTSHLNCCLGKKLGSIYQKQKYK